jgi:hypothetical protein
VESLGAQLVQSVTEALTTVLVAGQAELVVLEKYISAARVAFISLNDVFEAVKPYLVSCQCH